MTDVLLFQTLDNGDLEIENGTVTLTGSFETAVYVSLFGGNVEDAAGSDTSRSWWGNLTETENAFKYRSELQHLIGSIPAVSANLRRLENAALRDLNWMLAENIASNLEVSASLVALNRVNIEVTISAEGEETQFNYTENWKAGA